MSHRGNVIFNETLNVQGNFIGIAGVVGSGKSSLLSSVCGLLEKLNGDIALHCKEDGVAYVTQEPWLQHATIR